MDGLPAETTEEQMRALFARYGRVDKIRRERESKDFTGSVFVTMATREEAEKLVSNAAEIKWGAGQEEPVKRVIMMEEWLKEMKDAPPPSSSLQQPKQSSAEQRGGEEEVPQAPPPPPPAKVAEEENVVGGGGGGAAKQQPPPTRAMSSTAAAAPAEEEEERIGKIAFKRSSVLYESTNSTLYLGTYQVRVCVEVCACVPPLTHTPIYLSLITGHTRRHQGHRPHGRGRAASARGG